jgi:hypothetical protein
VQEFINKELDLAEKFVQETGCNIFLTGKAGTGKTTFLQKTARITSKRFIVTAPTGVAAINAKGVTLHSFFQLPFTPFIPGSDLGDKRFKISKEKRNIIKNLDLLIIDEISMVRSDVLDSIDLVLRNFRNSPKPFGGVQLMMIGDLCQLSPVVKNDELNILQNYYDSPYFFSSHALKNTEFITIELKHIFRQKDEKFINILNKLRDNIFDSQVKTELEKRYVKGFVPEKDDGCMILTTHNRTAQSFNEDRMNELDEKSFYFNAVVSGDFPSYNYPAPEILELKKGAQVMFLRNDPSPERLYFNGKTGLVTQIEKEKIMVFCPDDEKEVSVFPIEWENIKYGLDENNEIKAEITGKFIQFPIKPAWAITIHKSQGLTFEKAVIDAQDAFTHGQIYVALSRCTSLEGLILSSPLLNFPRTDTAVENFHKTLETNLSLEKYLENSKITYQQNMVLECFDFLNLDRFFRRFYYSCKSNSNTVLVLNSENIEKINSSLDEIFSVSEKFKIQLQNIFIEKKLPEKDSYLLDRIKKGSSWFLERLEKISNLIETIDFETDNKEFKKQLDNSLKNVWEQLQIKILSLKACENGFSPSLYLRAVSKAKTDFSPGKKKEESTPLFNESDIEHGEVFSILKKWRAEKAKEENVPHFQILHQSVIIQISVILPQNEKELMKIRGIGPKTYEKYGKDLLEIVNDYRKENKIEKVDIPEVKEKVIDSKPEKKKEKTGEDTKTASLNLYKKGLSIEGIAQERGLVQSTIEGHLSYFIEKGELDIKDFISAEKLDKIIEEIKTQKNDTSLREIKEKLGDDFSYGEIKMAVSYFRYVENRSIQA